MKAEIHPKYELALVKCSCGNEFETRSTKGDMTRRDLRRVPPVLHGQAEAHRHGWPRRALPEAAREVGARSRRGGPPPWTPVGGQAVLEGVMMRTPRFWAVSVRRPDGRISHISHAATSVAARRRLLRLPFIRGIVALGDSLAIGFRALGLSAQWAASDDDSDEVTEELSRCVDRGRVRVRDRLLAGAVQGLAGAAHQPVRPRRRRVRAGRGR